MYKKAQTIQPWLTEVHQALHRIPELDRDLPETTAYVAERLDEMGVPHFACAGGLVAELAGEPGAPVVALRADMDALPVTEATGLPQASRHAGKMHACGHDAHMACALGALRLLRGEGKRAATLRVLFQPAEETDGGAAKMIEAGALDGVSSALCLHVAPSLAVGQIGVISGPARGASDMFNVTLRGRGCHGAYPHLGADVVAGGAQIISALQLLVSRETSPLDPAVLTVGRFAAGTARNIIPDSAGFEGIVRTLNPATRARMAARVRELVEGMAAALRLSAEVEFIEGYPALVNDAEVAAAVRRVGAAELGAENVITPPCPQLGVDDFACIAERVPGCYVDLGARGPGGAEEPLHSPRFYPDEGCLPVGAALIAAWAQSQA
ncbi:M20 metallopeptidase family protein [Pyramidobacter sp.]|uniref:M20 metallopeptidase family protein n=1 Tax=Pyramidobacter sp. TaxID=1943581 RepID=UPI0025ED2667|nr:M20 family metallopeptidase [Pyramidobacter sp.]MCI7404472.1 M20 family metallopeptidase [Pyramidobacter sp.]MDY3211808.1 M20 family metallopeptidase [Pyramidobacter sp.]